jgi:hypothetical protein
MEAVTKLESDVISSVEEDEQLEASGHGRFEELGKKKE